jgi:Trk K+ transport system NAD-binding subunit/nucleotide-binding universal stress UspA family protein
MLETRAEMPAEPAKSAIEAERGPLLLLAGAPALARQLCAQLPNDWKVVLVSPDAGPPAGEEQFDRFHGDPTSAMVLRRAGAADARALLAGLTDPEENLEVCRLARLQLKLPRVVAILGPDEDETAFQALGVDVIAQNTVVATAARNLLERASVAVQEAGLGQGELVQITLQSSSPVVGRRLRIFRQRGWTVAAIFRGDQLVIPDPNTVLQSEDRLLLVGQPDRLSEIGEYLRVGRAQFPLPYGTVIAGPVWGAPSAALINEVAYLAAGVGLKEVALTICGEDEGWGSMAATLDLPAAVRWDKTSSGPIEAISALLSYPSPGCLVIPNAPARLPRPFAGVSRALRWALDGAYVPIFVPRGTFPYEQVLLPAARTPLPHGAVQVAFDLSEQLGAELLTVHVQAPATLEETSDAASEIDAAVDELAAVRRRQLKHERREGNPIAEIQRLAAAHQVMILSHRRGKRWRSLRPDVSAYLAQRFRSSVVILPVDS